jgi:hypothetical protein
MSTHPTDNQSENDLGTNILVQTPSMDSTTEQTCTRLLAEGEPPPDRTLWITYTRSPDEKLANWREYGTAAFPPRMGVVVVGDQTRATTTADSGIPTQAGGPVIRTIGDPTDLTGLSIELNQFFDNWATGEGRFTICFDSLTPLLVYVSVDRAYHFLHTLTTRVEALDVTAHYHIDPEAHDTQTVNRLTSLFDEIVEESEPEE